MERRATICQMLYKTNLYNEFPVTLNEEKNPTYLER